MNRRGFTLIEIIITIGVMGILMSIASYSFNEYSRKSAVESQTRKLYSDLMELRTKGLYEKRVVAMRISATGYALYSSYSPTMTGPYRTTTLKTPITWNNATVTDIRFNEQGMLQGVTNKSICANATNSASVDSVIVSMTMIKLGKLKDGTSCVENNIDAKQ